MSNRYQVTYYDHRTGKRGAVIRAAVNPEAAARRVANSTGLLRWPKGVMELTAGDGEFTIMEGSKQIAHLDVEVVPC